MNTDRFVKMFGCDTARITTPAKTLFLILGWNRRSEGEWTRNGKPYDFDYLAEQVVASGKTEAELIASAEEYKRLLGMTMEEHIAEVIGEQ